MDLVFSPNPALPADGRLLFHRVRGERAPIADVAALGLAATDDRALLVVPGDGGPQFHNHAVASVRLADALATLIAPQQPSSASVTTYIRAARLAVGLVAEHQIAPVLRPLDARVVATWQVLLPVGGMAADALAALADGLPAAGHALPRDTSGVWHPYALLRAFVDSVADTLVRHTAEPSGSTRPRARLLPWSARWQEAASDPVDATVPLGAERGETLAGVREWLRPYERPRAEYRPELVLEPPAGRSGAWVLRFGLRDRDGTTVPATQVWHGDSAQADSDRVEALLEALARAARVCRPIEEALDQHQPSVAHLDAHAAWTFIDETAPLLENIGFVTTLPDAVAELRPRLVLGTTGQRSTLDAAVEVHWQGTVGDEVVDADVVDELLARDEPLVFWHDRWVRVTPATRTQWEQRGGVAPRLPVIEAIGLAVAGVGTSGRTAWVSEVTQVTTVGPLATLLGRLHDEPAVNAHRLPAGFVGDLRAYQRDAVAWLDMMRRLDLGAVLADDMGLGKTVMLIAHLLQQGRGPHLVVCPTSVVTNWERELARFAPGLTVRRHHGPDRPSWIGDDDAVVVTSYGTLRRDIELLSAVYWHVVALDEAQQVKNPDTLSARSVRRLRSAHRVALTGTPVENRLRELWSVLDLTNPGLLGSRANFERRFATPIERRGDHATRTQLRRLIAPFVLRRTKSDPRVAPDLPPRIERTVPCALSDAQRERYQDAVERFRRTVTRGDSGMQYRGAVLALLTRLKQICDHPALGVDSGVRPAGRSGKLAVTRQLITEATQADERVLVFTQFVGMARILVDDLSRALQTTVPMLHGGMSATARQQVVDLFQGHADDPPPPVLVASLRAGGTGMNLTAATQVIHYDRWWNPAVEDQASDRAHRIGQTERVLIHRLMAVGTLEERIDALLEAKREMAAAVVGSTETWITELEPDALLELVRLRDGSDTGPVLAHTAADTGSWSSHGSAP
ncbi:MAG: DEAD/DEAH box helicase [Actinobacteria bacterium]|nr:DEAD/DEAH box helicase [Actinomycetota bacterium]